MGAINQSPASARLDELVARVEIRVAEQQAAREEVDRLTQLVQVLRGMTEARQDLPQVNRSQASKPDFMHSFPYSARNAAFGSTRAPRIAGIMLARTATTSSAAVTVPNTTGSRGD